MKKLLFITSNARKIEDYNRRFEPVGYRIEQLNIDLNEGRSLDIKEITHLKLQQAKKASGGKPVFVEDRGFFLPALNGFPGPFVKMFLKSIGIQGIIDLMQAKADRTAQFISVLGYWDSTQEHYFVETEEGFITKDIRTGNLRGWTDILYIYGYKTHPNRSLCELNDKEWGEYLQSIEKNDYMQKFLDFLSKRRILKGSEIY